MSWLGERIRKRRKELGLTQSQLAGKDLSKGFISLVETGRTRPSIETLMVLASRLRKPVGYFLDRDLPPGHDTPRSVLTSAWIALKRGEFTRAAEMFERARADGQKHDDVLEAACYIGLASALAGLGQLDLARQNVERGRALAETAADPRLMARVCHVLGLIEYYARNFARARQHFSEGYRLVVKVGHPDPSLAGDFLLKIGNTYEEVGDHEEALGWYRQAQAALEPTEDLHRIGMAAIQLGVAYRQQGHHDLALAQLTRAEHIFEILHSLRLLAQTRNSIGITLLEQGKIDEALRQLRSSLDIKDKVGDDPGRARTFTEIGRALTAKGQFKEAGEALARAEVITRKVRDATEGARITLAWARLHRAAGRPADAVNCYKDAIKTFDKLGMRAYLATACNEVGDLLIRQKRRSEAAPFLARALRTMESPRLPAPAEKA